MKVRISHVVTVNISERLAINHWYGLEGKATHNTVKDFLEEDHSLDEALAKFYRDESERYAKLAGDDASE